MNNFLRISILSLAIVFNNGATIHEHHQFSSILDYLTPEDYHKNTIVVLDIDNTIATVGHPFQWLGGDTWISHEIEKLIKTGLHPLEAIKQALPLYYELQEIIDLKPVEPSTPELIKQLQESGVTVIGLTIRSFIICDRTIEQLKAIGIDLSHAALGQDDFYGPDSMYRYKNGIIFCASGDKGTALKHILEHLKHTPTKIIVIDDKERHLLSVKQAFHPDIPVIGIRYAHLDEHITTFDPAVAEKELQVYLVSK